MSESLFITRMLNQRRWDEIQDLDEGGRGGVIGGERGKGKVRSFNFALPKISVAKDIYTVCHTGWLRN